MSDILGVPMAAGPGKKALNLTVEDSVNSRLDELCAHYDDANKGWLAVVLLKFGMRHVKRAMREHNQLAEGRFRDHDDELTGDGKFS